MWVVYHQRYKYVTPVHQRYYKYNQNSKKVYTIINIFDFFLDPGCYQLTKKANTSTNRTNTPSIDSLPTTPSSDL